MSRSPPQLPNAQHVAFAAAAAAPYQRPVSRTSSKATSREPSTAGKKLKAGLEAPDEFLADLDSEDEDMIANARPSLHRPVDGRSHQPLLGKDGAERGRTGYDNAPEAPGGERPAFSRRSTMRSRSPDTQAKLATRKKYTYAAFFLGLSLVSFVIQTETAVYIQHELGWNKAYCMLYVVPSPPKRILGRDWLLLEDIGADSTRRYFTHGSWFLLWPFQLLILRLQKWRMPWKIFWRRHIYLVRTTAQMVETQELSVPRTQHSPVPYMLRKTALVTCALTVAGGSWYVAVNLTSPSDLTAIYNCSAFFAYAFSVPLLKEKLRLDKSFAVAVAIVGVLIVAYGDAAPTKHGGKSGGSVGGGDPNKEASNRVAGNLVIGVGSVLYGFYEVLYKKLACPPEGTSPGRAMIFANTFGSLIGSFTLLVLWVPLPILHVTGLETFEFPRGQAARLLCVSVLANAVFSGSFLVLISLTSPVLSSVAALLTIFLVAMVDWAWTGVPLSPAAILGGLLIIAAFLVLSWSTYREMKQETRKKRVDLSDDDSENDD